MGILIFQNRISANTQTIYGHLECASVRHDTVLLLFTAFSVLEIDFYLIFYCHLSTTNHVIDVFIGSVVFFEHSNPYLSIISTDKTIKHH